MIRYITRHGQVARRGEEKYDHMFPPGDVFLSRLGEKQATLLGRRLKEMGFTGRIISSPYIRCLRTAELIANETESLIVPFAPFREVERDPEKMVNFKGLSIEEIRERFSHIDPEATLPYPWWGNGDGTITEEHAPEVAVRVKKGMEELETKYSDFELLFVGHGASAGAMLRVLEVPKKPRWLNTMLFNCSLSMIDLQSKEVKPFYCDISHMLYQDTTSNHLTYREFDAAYWEKEWEGEFSLPEGIDSIQGTKILHIGDTYSKLYPFYRKLIAELKPDIILHTGDMCDEVKVGRKPFLRYEYNTKIREILNIMEESGARIIIVPGNNDVADEIHAQCPTAEIYPENTVLELDGQMCRVGHQVVKMTFDQKWSFYGHGFTGEEWHLEDNVPGGPCRFNVSWGSFVYGLSEDKFFHIPHPKAHPDA